MNNNRNKQSLRQETYCIILTNLCMLFPSNASQSAVKGVFIAAFSCGKSAE